MQKQSDLFLCSTILTVLVITSACTVPISKPITVTGFKEYRNTSEGVRFEYPSSWQVDKASSSQYPATVRFRFLPYRGVLRAMFESGDTAALRTSPATIEEWRNDYLESLSNATNRSDFKLLTSEPATLSEYPAWRIEYTRLTDNSTTTAEIIFMMNGTRYALVALTGDDESDNIFSEGPQHFVRSIEITR